MVGILCEKPSAARNFAKALGGMNGTYNGEQYLIVASRGHLYEFAQPEEQVNAALAVQYKTWDIGNLPWNETDFSWVRVKKKDADSALKPIKDGLSQCSEICIATDVDPTGEGELLAWEILDELKLKPSKWSRLYFDDESEKEIQKGFKTRKQIQSMDTDMDYVKANFRSKFDFLSMQFTRIATLNGDGHSVLRQGRLKSAMVLIVGDQLKLVKGYKKIPNYQNRFRDENGVMYTNPDEPQFPKKDDVPNTYHASAVVCDSKTMKATPPPKFLDLATLSAKLSSKGIKAKDVLDVYQKMYESQIVSYPRTEDKVITPEQFNDLLPHIDEIAAVVGVDPSILTHRTPRSTHVKTGGAHGANRPGPKVPSSLDDLEANYGKIGRMIYEILAKNYLACVAEDYEYESQKGHVSEYPKFVGTSNVPKKMGWKVVFGIEEDEEGDDDEEKDSNKGLGTNAEPFIHEGFPPKPENPTMKWLMKQLEKHDVGTGATRTSIYADVTSESSKYPLLKETKGKLTMTEFGDMSYRLLPNTHIGNLKITEQLQADMRDIAAGKVNPEDCLHRMQQMVIDDVQTMTDNGKTMRTELKVDYKTGRDALGVCPRCGGEVVEGKLAFGCKNYKDGCKYVIWKKPKGDMFQHLTITEKDAKKLMGGNTIHAKRLVSKNGKEFEADIRLDDSEQSEYGPKLSLEFTESEKLGTCPRCGGDIVAGKSGYGCKNYKDGCKFIIWKEPKGDVFKNVTISASNVETLLSGKSIHVKNLVGKSGQKFEADISLDDSEKSDYGPKLVMSFSEPSKLGTCPRCGGDIVEGKMGFGCKNYKDGCKYVIWKKPKGDLFKNVTISAAQAEKLIKGEKVHIKRLYSAKLGKEFEADISLNDSEKSDYGPKFEMSFDKSETPKVEVGKCPRCGSPVYANKNGFGCSGWKDGCKFSIWKEYPRNPMFRNITITEPRAKALLEGKNIHLKRLVSPSTGKEFEADVKMDDSKKSDFGAELRCVTNK